MTDGSQNDRAALDRWLGLAAAYALLAAVAFGPSLDGSFVSDDALVIVGNPYVQELSATHLREIADPFGPAVLYSMNYAPVHLLFHAGERALFGERTNRYRAVNLALHVATALLLVALLRGSGLGFAVSAGAGAVFVVHPANAEAVSMVFQAKTLLSTGLALGAVLLFWRRPGLSVLVFGLAILTKFTAAFALPMVAALAWSRRSETQSRPHAGWMLAWLAILALVAIPEFSAFSRIGQHAVALGDGVFDRARSIAAIAGHYMLMAATGIGVSASHSPSAAPAVSDPRWIAGALGLLALGVRAGRALARGSEEGAWWLAAAAAYAPVSQVFPFLYPMADRYLYAALPGLLGGTLLALRGVAPAVARFSPALHERRFAIGVALLLLVAAAFCVASRSRSPVFRSDRTLMLEAARNYPDGLDAWLLEYERAANDGDVEATRAALRALEARAYNVHQITATLPEPLAEDEEIVRIRAAMASHRVAHYESLTDPYPLELRLLADAVLATGRPEEALEIAERALHEDGAGPEAKRIRDVMRRARLELRGAEAGR